MSARRCEHCGVGLGRFVDEPVCPACQSTSAPADAPANTPTPTSALLWAAADTQAVLSTRDLARILVTYRRVNHLSQRVLADQLGFDQSYICLLERGARRITDRGMLAHIARRLAIPPHVLGITEDDDVDYATMLQTADSTIRLAEIARQTGNAAAAVNELWPLVTRLETRVAGGRAEREVLILLTQARAALGTSLGHILPRERLDAAAHWTGRALAVAERLDDTALLGHALRMHGNETRKAGHVTAAIPHLHQAHDLADDPTIRGETLVLLSRAAGASGNTDLFDRAITACRRLLDHADHTALFNPFTVREVHMRGLLDTDRATSAHDLTANHPDGPISPQWQVIERVTTGQVHLAAAEIDAGAAALDDAITAADRLRLPQQAQRAIRAARTVLNDMTRAVADRGAAVVQRLTSTAKPPQP